MRIDCSGLFVGLKPDRSGRQVAEFGLVVLGLSIVLISGGIDLSVASVFTVAVLSSLVGINV